MKAWSRNVEARVALFVVAAGSVACSTVLGIESNRHYVAPQEDAGSNEPPDTGSPDTAPAIDAPTAPLGWECIDDPVPSTPSGNVKLELFMNDVSTSQAGSSGTPIVGAEVHACNKLDFDCVSPFTGVTTNDAGVAELIVHGGFDGYYEVHASGFSPAVLSRSPQLTNERSEQGMANLSLIAQGAPFAGVTQDADKTVSIVTVADCSSIPAAGIVLEVGSPGANEEVVYLANRLPSRAATQTDIQSGSALIFNVPAGTLIVSAYFAADHRPIRTISTLARKDWVTFVQIRLDQSHGVPPSAP